MSFNAHCAQWTIWFQDCIIEPLSLSFLLLHMHVLTRFEHLVTQHIFIPQQKELADCICAKDYRPSPGPPFAVLLQIPITVVYLDRSMAAFAAGQAEDDAAVNLHNFVPETMQKDTSAAVQPRVHLLYRPGHYDILYPKAIV